MQTAGTAGAATTRLVAHSGCAYGRIDRRLFGSFVEHMGRVVYGGVYEPGHPEADQAGRRTDVLRLVRELGVTCVRYPGGNFVSGLDWRDLVGPVQDRPRRLDLAWRAVETHEFGLPEFMAWAQAAQAEPILAVNLGTGGIAEAAAMVEYCNFPGGTRESDLRRRHGQDRPYGVKTWCLGNEMDGDWQLGAKGADEYGRLAAESAKAMRRVDDSIELAVCGSSKSDQPSFPEWDLEVLRHAYPYVDYLAAHQYYGGQDLGTGGFLAQAQDFDRYLGALEAVCDVAKAAHRSRKTLAISVDEWGVWNFAETGPEPDQWQVGPRLSEQIYTLQDALLFASMMLVMARHSSRVRMACQSLLTNISACIMTEPGGEAWVQPIYHPFQALAAWAGADVLRPTWEGPHFDAAGETGVPVVDALVTRRGDIGRLGVFAVNRDADADRPLEFALAGSPGLRVVGHTVMTADDALATGRDQPSRFVPRESDESRVSGGTLAASLPPLSWTVITLEQE
ncbi:MAG: alpha-L-arabinofuranosidase [Bifidobacteriaceae bacterium]|jgi:alpha-N-arabinofuranosidase|nr:alpha-L-arabinofuranosidase [Bifidobacteriaceae bacterium]